MCLSLPCLLSPVPVGVPYPFPCPCSCPCLFLVFSLSLLPCPMSLSRSPCVRQFLHAPAPLGSPHIPHGAGPGAAARLEDDPFALTANTDSCFSSAVLSQAGQDGVWSARVRYSNW